MNAMYTNFDFVLSSHRRLKYLDGICDKFEPMFHARPVHVHVPIFQNVTFARCELCGSAELLLAFLSHPIPTKNAYSGR